MKVPFHEDEYPALVRLLKGVDEEPGDDEILDNFLRRLRTRYNQALQSRRSSQ